MERISSASALIKYIRQHGLEQILPESVWHLLELQIFRKGEYLCHAGDRIASFHIVVSGKCNVLASSEDGKEAIINTIVPIGISGDIEFFIDCPAINSVYAATDVTVSGRTNPSAAFAGGYL